MKPRVVVLVPYRPNRGPVGQRYRWLWDQVKPRLEEIGEVFTGKPRTAQWSRSEAVNAAARNAGEWDVALVGDCDTVPDPDSIRRAVAWVLDTGGAARPHNERYMLTGKGTLVFCQRGPRALNFDARAGHFDRQFPGGGLLVVTREAFDKVGGYNETFRGWGYEDSDFNLRLLHHTTWDRLPGTAWHLWHPRVDNTPSEASKLKYRHLMKVYSPDIERWARDKGLKNAARVF